jgi:hypothetical protein
MKKHVSFVIHIMLGIVWGLFISVGYVAANGNLITTVGLGVIATILVIMIRHFIINGTEYTDVEECTDIGEYTDVGEYNNTEERSDNDELQDENIELTQDSIKEP